MSFSLASMPIYSKYLYWCSTLSLLYPHEGAPSVIAVLRGQAPITPDGLYEGQGLRIADSTQYKVRYISG